MLDCNNDFFGVYSDAVLLVIFALSLPQAELKNLMDISSCSFEFAKELIRHNLVSSLQGCEALHTSVCLAACPIIPLLLCVAMPNLLFVCVP